MMSMVNILTRVEPALEPIENINTDFASFYDVNVKIVYGYLYYRLRHRQTAEDLTEQTFLKALENFHRFDGQKASFKTWVFRIARNTLMQTLNEAKKTTQVSLGLIARLYPGIPSADGQSQIPILVDGQAFLSTLAPNIPEGLLRTIDTKQYLLGIHSFDENQSFLILKVDAYEQAYSGMLAWERTMRIELSPLFTRNISPRIETTHVTPALVATSSTSTPPTPPPPAPVGFVDRIVENHDARVIQNEWGDLLLLWTFLDRTTIVITTNEHTLREIISRRKDINIIPHI